MFWRIIRRLIAANRGRLFVVLLALGAGAAITAALLNLQVDAKRRLTTEFRAFGPNVIIAPSDTQSSPERTGTIEESVAREIPPTWNARPVSAASFLYLIAEARAYSSAKPVQAVVVGRRSESLQNAALDSRVSASETPSVCDVGTKVAAQLNLHTGDKLLLTTKNYEQPCSTEMIGVSGGPEDSQIFVSMPAAQRLAALPAQVSVIQLGVSGKPPEIATFVELLQIRLPQADVHGLRQFTGAEANIYNRISGLLTATVALVLTLTALCVMAAMTNVAMERRMDVGLMKAIGGATRRVLRLFLAEAAVLGLAGGVLGAAVGILISVWLGKAVFGIAARPRFIVYPIAVALTILVAIAGAYPLRRLANIRPASVFRGEA
jgi:putative ABC transport system permease protein